MTSKIEKQFFDTFGIKPRVCLESCYKCQNYSYDYCYSGYCTLDSHYDNCGVAIKLYPQITDHTLLELICIANKYYIDLEGTDIETMKNSLLENFMFFKRDVNEDIRTLFEEV